MTFIFKYGENKMMKKRRLVQLVSLLILAVGLFFSYKAFFYQKNLYQVSFDNKAEEELGDLHLVLEVQTNNLLERLARSTDKALNTVLEETIYTDDNVNISTIEIINHNLSKKGISLNKYYGSKNDDDSKIIDELSSLEKDVVLRIITIMKNRLDSYGIPDPVIRQKNMRQIMVDLSRVASGEEIKQLLLRVAYLEFRLVRDDDYSMSLMNKIDIVRISREATDMNMADSTKYKSTIEHPFFSIVMINTHNNRMDAHVEERRRNDLITLLDNTEIQSIIPGNVEFLFSSRPFHYEAEKTVYRLFLVNKTPELTGGYITKALAKIDPKTETPTVDIYLNAEGSKEWSRITGAHVGKRIAIIVDKSVLAVLNIRGMSKSRNLIVDEVESLNEAKLLEILLNSGMYPTSVKIIEESVK